MRQIGFVVLAVGFEAMDTRMGAHPYIAKSVLEDTIAFQVVEWLVGEQPAGRLSVVSFPAPDSSS